MPTNNVGHVDQSNAVEGHSTPQANTDTQVSSIPPSAQPQKTSLHPVPGLPMPLPFHQAPIPIQYSGPRAQLHPHGMITSSVPRPIPIPLQMGGPQIQQQVYAQTLQSHLMQPQGFMPQSQNINFSSQLGTQMPQLGSMGINITSQFLQQQPGNLGSPRRAVKITHPETHEELTLSQRTNGHQKAGSSDPLSHPNASGQSQPSPFSPSGHTYNLSYSPGSTCFTGPSSLPLSSTQISPSSQVPRLYNQVIECLLLFPQRTHFSPLLAVLSHYYTKLSKF